MKLRGTFCERSMAPKASVAKKSFRWKRSGKAWVLVGCPRGKFKRGRCAVGLHAVKLLVPARGRCQSGKRIVK